MSTTPTPTPTPKPPVHTTSHHEVAEWIKQQQEAGVLRKCAHLNIAHISWSSGDDSEFQHFIPECKRNSFDWRSGGGLSKEGQLEYLRVLYDGIISCPNNCVNYRSSRVARWLWYLRRPFRAPQLWLIRLFRWFHKLPWQTQVAFIGSFTLLLILKFAPQWLPQILELVKAFRGK